MKNRKLSFILLLNLILIFVILIIAYMSFITKGNGDTNEIRNKVTELDGNIREVQLRIDEWDELIKSNNSVSINTNNNEPEDKVDAKEDKKDTSDNDKKKEEPNDEKVDDEEKKKEEDKPKKESFTSSASALNIRATPSTSANVIDVVNSGGKVTSSGKTVEADGYTWLEVMVSGKTGWAVKDYLK